MPFRLEIRFTGLCAIIPEKDLADSQNEASVVLVNAQASPHGPHRSLLFFDSSCYIDPDTIDIHEPKGNRLAGSLFNFDGGQRKGFVLDGEELMFLTRNAVEPRDLLPLQRNSLRFAVGKRPYPPRPCPVEADRKDFTWAAQNPGAIDPTILNSVDLGYLIAARTRLSVGVFETEKFRLSPQGLIRWWFDGTESVAIAEQVKLRHDFEDPTIGGITVTSAPFRGYSQQPHLHLKPHNGTIKIWIVNMPLEDVLKVNQPSRLFDPDHHYEEYYRLCWWTPSFSIPYPDRLSFCPNVTAASNPKCPPTYFAPLTFQSAVAALSRGAVNPVLLRQQSYADKAVSLTKSMDHGSAHNDSKCVGDNK